MEDGEENEFDLLQDVEVVDVEVRFVHVSTEVGCVALTLNIDSMRLGWSLTGP